MNNGRKPDSRGGLLAPKRPNLELSATNGFLMAYESRISLLYWIDFPQNSGFGKVLNSRFESKMAADPGGSHQLHILTNL